MIKVRTNPSDFFSLLNNIMVFFLDKQQALERYDICKQCPDFKPTLKICGRCGCFMPAKVRIKQSICPASKWLPHENTDSGVQPYDID